MLLNFRYKSRIRLPFSLKKMSDVWNPWSIAVNLAKRLLKSYKTSLIESEIVQRAKLKNLSGCFIKNTNYLTNSLS